MLHIFNIIMMNSRSDKKKCENKWCVVYYPSIFSVLQEGFRFWPWNTVIMRCNTALLLLSLPVLLSSFLFLDGASVKCEVYGWAKEWPSKNVVQMLVWSFSKGFCVLDYSLSLAYTQCKNIQLSQCHRVCMSPWNMQTGTVYK